MSRITKVALILLVAAITLGAKQLVAPATQEFSGAASTPSVQISPEEITRAAGVLPETKVESYY